MKSQTLVAIAHRLSLCEAVMLDRHTAAKPAQLVTKQMFSIFVTPMFTGMLPDIGLCDRIEQKLREI
jgi:hypothetical protein